MPTTISLQVQVWELLVAGSAIIAFLWLFAERQLERRRRIDGELRAALKEHVETNTARINAIDARLNQLPDLYVSQSSYIRGQTLVTHKLDAIGGSVHILTVGMARAGFFTGPIEPPPPPPAGP